MEMDMLVQGQHWDIMAEFRVHVNPDGYFVDEFSFKIDSHNRSVVSPRIFPYYDVVLDEFGNFDISGNNIDSELDNHFQEIQSSIFDEVDRTRITQSRYIHPSDFDNRIDEIDQASLDHLEDLLRRLNEFEFELYLTTLDRKMVVF